MDIHHHHEELILEIKEELKDIFENSSQGIYLYLDDIHKACNKKYASMLGFNTPKEWEDIPEDVVGKTVVEKSQEGLISAYQRAMENLAGSAIEVIWKNKNGGEVATKVILVPITFKGHIFALHFVSEQN